MKSINAKEILQLLAKPASSGVIIDKNTRNSNSIDKSKSSREEEEDRNSNQIDEDKAYRDSSNSNKVNNNKASSKDSNSNKVDKDIICREGSNFNKLDKEEASSSRIDKGSRNSNIDDDQLYRLVIGKAACRN